MKNLTYTLAWTTFVLALTISQCFAQSTYEPYTFTTLAGNALDSADGTTSAARFNFPSGVAVDSAGNVYVADRGNHTIRKVTPAGVATTLAGHAPEYDINGNPVVGGPGRADGTGSGARFNQPSGVALDSEGNVYVADTGNHTIRKVTPAGVVTTLAGLAGSFGSADETGSAARFHFPAGVAVDRAGNVYVADTYNDTIRKVTPAGAVTTLAGLAGSIGSADGTRSAARFYLPSNVTVDSPGNVYVADTLNGTIRKVTSAGVVTTLAGLAGSIGSADGAGNAALFDGPFGVAVDNAGSLYVSDRIDNTIRKVTPAGVVTTLAGLAGNQGSADGTGSAARFFSPHGVAVDSADSVYLADTSNHTIRKVTSAGLVTTLAGLAGFPGSADGTARAAQFNAPTGATVDSAGNVYVADHSHTIRKVTPAGVVTTLAGLAGFTGNADGTGSAARFSFPTDVAVDNAGNVYVTDQGSDTIRKVTPAGVVTTLAGLTGSHGSADGTGSAARFDGPSGVAVDPAGNIYVSDRNNNTIRKVTPSGVVTTLAGHPFPKDRNGNPIGDSVDGTGSDAGFNSPAGVAVDNAGNVYVADIGNATIRKVTPAGVVTTLAGLATVSGSADGIGSAARFSSPTGVAVDSTGNVYVADSSYHTIRKVTPAGVVTTLAGLAGSAGGTDGTGGGARFNQPYGEAIDNAGNVYVADNGNNTIRKMTPAGVVTTLIGLPVAAAGSANGTGSAAQFNSPTGAAMDSAGNVYVADQFNHTIRKVTPAGVVTTLAGRAGNPGSVDGTGGAAQFNQPFGVAVDSVGNVYVGDSGNNTIRKMTPAGVVTTLAGDVNFFRFGSADGTGSAAKFNRPEGVAVDSVGNVYLADAGNNTIRKVTAGGVVTTLAGLAGNFGSADGTGNAARFNQPIGEATDSAGNVYVADYGNHTIRKVTSDGVVTTLAGLAGSQGSADGTGNVARFSGPSGVAVDGAGNVYVAETGGQTIRKVTPSGVVTTLAGLAGSQGSADGTGIGARFNAPYGVAVDSAGNVYVADTGNNTIRKGFAAAPAEFHLMGPYVGPDDGKFGFNLTGPAERFVVVEASTDLVNWLPIWTNAFAGDLIFNDPQIVGFSNRFYRAHLP